MKQRCGLSVGTTSMVAMVVSSMVTVGVTGCDRSEQTDAEAGTATVTGVVDGDTIDVDIGGRDERVRLIGIDTPETKRPNSPIECFGPEASSFTAELLPVGTEVRLVRDVVGRDDYGRLLAYVYTVDDAVFVNLEIVRQGYAVPLTIEPNSTFAADIAEAAIEAEWADTGLWAACSDEAR